MCLWSVLALLDGSRQSLAPRISLLVRSRKSALGIFIRLEGRQWRSSGLIKKYPSMGFMVLRVWLGGELGATRLQASGFERQVAIIQIADPSRQQRAEQPFVTDGQRRAAAVLRRLDPMSRHY